MLSSTQYELTGQIVCQYDYYLVYNFAEYHNYLPTEVRDNKIILICSDSEPVFNNGSYHFENAFYYEITYNRSILIQNNDVFDFHPVNNNDIIYTNIVKGYPQLCYSTSRFRNYDALPLFMYIFLGVFMLAVILRVIFGGK